ncbi:UDP-N-acetylmuramoyl-L-alanine--D-glutamate ligase [uncultured Porphyromonas sp.]|uniref:UDP-N-acetylmuramoyl-L-alanine--D-glutamate ligase n=1 Tax=uncultured Porphyromonas sp. TaxID=159274 RepID=UPI002632E66A|nr:UDP-N-acetylmuramoyl-L-alanine--D-glutamate ligase [uncultured Porphyromonas sp.]
MQRNEYIILGAGESGVGAAILAQQQGLPVFVSDSGQIKPQYKAELEQYSIPYEEGGHTFSRILSAQEVIKSPGIPDSAPLIRQLTEQQTPIISEIEFAYRYAGNSVMIAITGSNGKTTTTNWLYHTLHNAGLDVSMAGNVGTSLARQVALTPHAYYVIELSSFQLDHMYQFRAHIAILLNITPDHLDRYDHQMELYARAKMRITQNQEPTDYFISWIEDDWTQRLLKEPGMGAGRRIFFSTEASSDDAVVASSHNGQLRFALQEPIVELPESALALSGKHNEQNALAVGCAAQALGVKPEIIRASLETFTNVPHRLEYIASVDGVDYINDSKATNINSTWYALESMRKPTILILGGTDKGNDYNDLMDLVKEKVVGMIYLTTDSAKLHRSFDSVIPRHEEVTSMRDAIATAHQMAKAGETVLLSPACASFDLFTCYEDRGDQFRAEVLAIAQQQGDTDRSL